MKLVHYSDMSGEKEYVVMLQDGDEPLDWCNEFFGIQSVTAVPDISGFPVGYILNRE